jgi:hypothetical protein
MQSLIAVGGAALGIVLGWFLNQRSAQSQRRWAIEDRQQSDRLDHARWLRETRVTAYLALEEVATRFGLEAHLLMTTQLHEGKRRRRPDNTLPIALRDDVVGAALSAELVGSTMSRMAAGQIRTNIGNLLDMLQNGYDITDIDTEDRAPNNPLFWFITAIETFEDLARNDLIDPDVGLDASD